MKGAARREDRKQAPPPVSFAHASEEEFARILDFYGVGWQYEPRSFPLREEEGRVLEAFTPDFYLPDLDLYIELTTLKQRLVTEKHRKLRRFQERYPDIQVKLLHKSDYLSVLAKYGFGHFSEVEVAGLHEVLISASQLERRVGELGAQISRDYRGQEPLLIGVLRGVTCFMADLMRHISLPLAIDFMAISSYEGEQSSLVRIMKDLEEPLEGRNVLVVEDIVDTGTCGGKRTPRVPSPGPPASTSAHLPRGPLSGTVSSCRLRPPGARVSATRDAIYDSTDSTRVSRYNALIAGSSFRHNGRRNSTQGLTKRREGV